MLIFDGIMDAEFYILEILTNRLLPFIKSAYPHGHRFQQDNDPRHASRLNRTFMEENEINWWKTPPESPDLNPIELLWHELKPFLRTTVRPKTKEELVDGISRFWYKRVNAVKCCTYIRHLHTALPLVVARRQGLRKVKKG